MNKPDLKKLDLLNLPYALCLSTLRKVGAAASRSRHRRQRQAAYSFAGFAAAFASIRFPASIPLICLSALPGRSVRLVVYIKGKNAKKYRRAKNTVLRDGGPDDIKPYIDPEFENNVLLTQTERLTMNSRPKQPKYARNKNILVSAVPAAARPAFL